MLKNYTDALTLLSERIDLSDRIGSLQMYATARTIADSLCELIEQEYKDIFPQSGMYALEKIGLFINYLAIAVMPQEGAQQPPRYWLETAIDNLEKVASWLRGQQR